MGYYEFMEEGIVLALRKHGPLDARALCVLTGYDQTACYRCLKQMAESGSIKVHGYTKTATKPIRVWEAA